MPDLITLFATPLIQWLVILLAIDVVLGITTALVRKEFVFGKLCNFMKAPLLGYIFGFAVIELIGIALPSLAFIVPVVFILIVIALLASIFGNLGKLGLPVPGILKK